MAGFCAVQSFETGDTYVTLLLRSGIKVFFFVIPIAFASFVSACYLLGRALPFGLPSWLAFTGPVFAALFALLSLLAWRFGIQHYQSTGS